MADWSELPKDLLLLIAKHLESCFDITHFRSVCPNWRASIPSDLRPPPTLCSPNLWIEKESEPFLFKRTTCLFKFPADLGQTTPRFWLVTLEEDEFGKKHILDPVSGRKLMSVQYPMLLDISNLHVQELNIAYSIQETHNVVFPRHCIPISDHLMLIDDANFYPNIYTRLEDANRPLRLFKCENEVASTIQMGGSDYCVDFIQIKGKFYAIDISGTTICFDPFSGTSFPVAKSGAGGTSLFFVEACGNLLLVELTMKVLPRGRRPIVYQVFQLDEDQKKWDRLHSLGNGIIVDGDYCKFFVPAIPGVEGNCIVYTKADGVAYVFHLNRWTKVPLDSRSDLHRLFTPHSF